MAWQLAAWFLSFHQLSQAPSLLTHGQRLRDTEQEVCRGQVPHGGGPFVCTHRHHYLRQHVASLALVTFVQHGDHSGTSAVKGGEGLQTLRGHESDLQVPASALGIYLAHSEGDGV